ncbi:hypothetical protein SLITK23_37640 [Streptomyces lividans]|uniref:Integrase n=2 Tax=Streptomyces TaxID=1883 RepID=A0A7U9HBP5_STRLI|nr:predicted protein [Streptomyces lividans TK24]EOY48838.1 integrase [Streptomyces lividans 1326]KKD15456.1 hypothetical protein TR66_09955 [Streptomyces sp. WM6391]MYU43395.1 hypothetical protein [Streptomyces sp. SID7813]NSL78787.1 hypothetical protein [Streptomyces coelicolor]QFI43873.1 hypothetical protein FQ762_19945 [Streptomyces coelicolor A3(2)]BDE40519.1 hypothetical protein SLITK23_37640 [Streptomyces lividans]GHA33244.1 hypothetical protein GCM10010391_16460 [Streptomyces anthocy
MIDSWLPALSACGRASAQRGRSGPKAGAAPGAQAILRHSQISMTMDVYTHVVGDSEREAVGMLAELLEDPLIG